MKKALTMLHWEVMSTSSTPVGTAGKPDKSMFARLGVFMSEGDLALDITNRVRSSVGARIVSNKTVYTITWRQRNVNMSGNVCGNY